MNKHRLFFCIRMFPLLGVALMVCGGCGAKEKARFSFPSVPSSVQGQTARRQFLALHFWDRLSVSDSVELTDEFHTDSIVRLFVALLQKNDEATQRKAFRCWARAVKKAPSLVSVMDNARVRVLDAPRGDVRLQRMNEEVLTAFLSERAGNAAWQNRWRNEWKVLVRNRVGCMAQDFEFFDTEGQPHTLKQCLGRGRVLLFFFDPECEDCAEAQAVMNAERETLFRGVTVVGVYVGGEETVWRLFCQRERLPWVLWGTDRGLVFRRSLYGFRHLPSFYLLSPTGRILLSNGSIEDVLAFLSKK